RLEATVLALAERFPGERIEALGLADTKAWPANVTPHAAGLLDHAAIDALYLGARVVVFPSQAEGFGFPVLDALARRRPVFV
ncbi:glycosyltransferase, partial [Vibrio parahaemolyticus]